MEQRIYYGNITPQDFANALMAAYNRSNLHAQALGSGNKMAVQIATRPGAQSGGHTAVTVHLQKTKEGVVVQIGQQAWYGVAASLGQTALSALRNPWNLLGRLDDIAQDLENLQLSETVWGVIERTAQTYAASKQITEQLTGIACAYCNTSNTVGAPSCVACGAPLGNSQPRTCGKCGYIVRQEHKKCPNCRAAL